MQFVLDCVTTLLIAILCFFMLFQKYEIKKDRLILRIIGIFGIIAVKVGIILLKIAPLNLFMSLVMCLAVIKLYECKIRTALLYSFVYDIMTLVTDAFGVLLVSAFYGNTITETLGANDLIWHHHIWNWIMLLFLSRMISLFIRKNENINVRWHEFVFYIFLLLYEVIFFASVSSAIQDYMSGRFLIFLMLGFMILDICVMVIFNRISAARESEQRLRLMHQQEELQHQMYQELQKKYTETCKVAHDIKRHVSSLKSLIETNGSDDKAQKYLSELTEESDRLYPAIRNQNPMLEIILNTTMAKCKSNNIEFSMSIEDFEMPFISDMDMTTIFSNLFDNAIEACKEIVKSRRKIRMIMRAQMGLIVIKITNSCADFNISDIKFGRSTKKNHSGIGLSNVRKAVEKYEGIMNVKNENNMFCVSITFVNKI